LRKNDTLKKSAFFAKPEEIDLENCVIAIYHVESELASLKRVSGLDQRETFSEGL